MVRMNWILVQVGVGKNEVIPVRLVSSTLRDTIRNECVLCKASFCSHWGQNVSDLIDWVCEMDTNKPIGWEKAIKW